MNKTVFLLLLFFVNTAIADMSPAALGGPDLINFSAIVPHDQDYYTKQIRNVELIYTEKNLDTARHVADVQIQLQPVYEDIFGYKLDEILRIGILSDHNQDANGFATPLPYVLQVGYIGSALVPDHFATTSWIDGLQHHETVHNFQMNAKDSAVSRSMHTVLKNGVFITPWFTNPNILTTAFLIEGNAVMNESWHGNGGRLYNGQLKVETLMQAKAGLLTPGQIYTENLEFLYGSHNYTLGSYFQYFLAENYGLKKTNSFWKVNSRDWYWPFKTNYAYQRVFGKNFETLVAEWSEQYAQEAEKVTEAQGQLLASSQFYTRINADKDEIYFITNPSGREYPDIVVYDKKTHSMKYRTTTHLAGKVIKTQEGEYATQGSNFVNPWRRYIGLLDEGTFVIDGTRSKVIEGYLTNGKVVYFDVTLSYDRPQLFIGDEFYASVNSSVLVDDNDVYYFKQKDKKRTLYKNKQPLFTFNAFYGHVVGVNDSGVYFISNTEHGAGLYRYSKTGVDLMNPADTIFDARLIDEKTALVVSVDDSQYKYMVVDLQAHKQQPYEVSLLMEKQPYYESANPAKHPPSDVPTVDLEDDYYSLLDMHYSGIDLNLGSDSNAGLLYDLSINFIDPLLQNSLSLFATKGTDEYSLGGATYANSQYFLTYELTAYGVMDRPDPEAGKVEKNKRNSGIIANASIPFLRSGYYFGDIGASYFQDYSSNSRQPKGLNLTLANAKFFGVSKNSNFFLSGTAYGTEDRGDKANGGVGLYQQGLPNEFFITARAQYSSSDAANSTDDRGIKIASSQAVIVEDSDISTIVMPGIKADPSYAKKVTKYGAQVKKVFNFSAYYFTFPISLRREALYLGYNRYEITDFASSKTGVNESTIGLELDTVWLNNILIPINMEYIYTDDKTIADSSVFRIQAGIIF